MPVIISLKCSCSWEQQKVMADILKEELGDMLLPRGFGVVEDQLPTPWDLRRKILLKGRRIEGKTNNELYKLFFFTTSHSTDFTEDTACTVVNSCDDAEAARRIGDSIVGGAWAHHNRTHMRYVLWKDLVANEVPKVFLSQSSIRRRNKSAVIEYESDRCLGEGCPNGGSQLSERRGSNVLKSW